MRIKFFLLGTEKHSSAKRLESDLKYVFSDYLTDNGDVQSFDDIKKATNSIAKAISDTHAVVFIAEKESFSATKLMLSKAFGFDLSCDVNLLQRACESFGKSSDTEDYEFSVTHAFVPPQSRTFVLEDGRYAGFSVANGNQTIILLPFEKDRTSYLLTSQVIPYINATYHISVDVAGLKRHNTQMLADILEERNMKIAVAGTNTASFFKEYISTNEKLASRTGISPITEKRGNMQPVDYVVNLSVAASELLACRYGVAISNAFYTGDSPDSEKIVYLAVTNERETAVREIHSFEGEDIPAFLARCSGDLCVFIADIIDNDDDYAQDKNIREKAAVKRYKTAIITVASLIVAALLFCLVYFTVHDYSLGQWGSNAIEFIFPGGNPFEGMFGNNDAPTELDTEWQPITDAPQTD